MRRRSAVAAFVVAMVGPRAFAQQPPPLGTVPIRPSNRVPEVQAALAFRPTAKTFGGAVVEIARRNIGKGESGANNAGPYVDIVTQTPPTVTPAWCAAWVSAMYFAASYALQVAPPWVTWRYGRDGGIDPELWVPTLVDNAKRAGRFVDGRARAPSAHVPPGSVLFVRGGPNGWSHTGIVEKVDGLDVHSIEGNVGASTSPTGLDIVGRVARSLAACDYGLS